LSPFVLVQRQLLRRQSLIHEIFNNLDQLLLTGADQVSPVKVLEQLLMEFAFHPQVRDGGGRVAPFGG